MTAFLGWQFSATGAPTPRSLPDRLAEIVNVKDFGAVGDGSHDDTPNIQAAFNAAYGSPSSPNGLNYFANKKVFFPAGHYNVTSPTSTKTVTGASSNAGFIRLTLNNTTGLVTGMNVLVDGIVGTIEANACWTITVDDSTHITLQRSGFAVAWVSGGTVSTFALTLDNVTGGHIYGTGRLSVQIENSTSGGSVIGTDGFQKSVIEGLHFRTGGNGGACLALNHYLVRSGSTVQSNTIRDCSFEGGNYGVLLADAVDSNTQYGQGSESVFINNYWQQQTVAGLVSCNANALQTTVIGGNIAGCPIGIWCNYGAVNRIDGVGFQQQTDCDIKISNNSDNTMVVTGCRTESDNFLKDIAGHTVSIIGCHKLYNGVTPGTFYSGGSRCGIHECWFYGNLDLHGAIRCTIENSYAAGTTTDWLPLNASLLYYIPNNAFAALVCVRNTYHEYGTAGYIDDAIYYTKDGSTITTQNYKAQTAGTVTLNGTTPVTVSNAAVTANSQVSFALKTVGGTVGAYPTIKTITAGTGFTVAGTAGDTSIYNYAIAG